jgi:hypothetical protein
METRPRETSREAVATVIIVRRVAAANEITDKKY